MHFVNAKSLLSNSNGMNIYRGCTHGCIYCDSRSLCYQMNHQFEDIEVKQNAPELLEIALKSKRKKCMIGTGAMSDPYLHCEKDLLLTQKCIQLIEKNGFGLAIQTKSDMILRDIEVLKSINKKAKCVVQITLTTADDNLCKIVEPNVCPTSKRVEVLKKMKEVGISTVVWLTPFLPFINGTMENLKYLLNICLEVGVKGIILFGAGLTLRNGNREYFYAKLDEKFPGLKKKYIENFGLSYEIPCSESYEMVKYARNFCKKYNILMDEDVFTYMKTFEDKSTSMQLDLFN